MWLMLKYASKTQIDYENVLKYNGKLILYWYNVKLILPLYKCIPFIMEHVNPLHMAN